MKEVLQNAIKKVQQEISGAHDESLQLGTYVNNLIQKYLPKKLAFSGDKNVHDIETIDIREYFSQSGQGGSYSPGDTAERVQMTKNITGSSEVFAALIKNGRLPMSSDFAPYQQGTFGMVYMGYARKIKNNDQEIARLKMESDQRFQHVEETLNKVNAEIDTFENNELHPFIKQAIKNEVQNRADSENTRNRLK